MKKALRGSISKVYLLTGSGRFFIVHSFLIFHSNISFPYLVRPPKTDQKSKSFLIFAGGTGGVRCIEMEHWLEMS